MKRYLKIMLVISPVLLFTSGTTTACSDSTGPNGSGGCCRVCTTGKACGDSCISKSKTCNVGPGCACNG